MNENGDIVSPPDWKMEANTKQTDKIRHKAFDFDFKTT